MANQQLVDYIKSQLQMGVPRESLKNTLLQTGWPEAEVRDAMDAAGGASAPAMTAAPVTPTVPRIGGAGPAVTPDIFQPKTSGPVFQSKSASPLGGAAPTSLVGRPAGPSVQSAVAGGGGAVVLHASSRRGFVLVVIILLAVGAAAFFGIRMVSLSAKVNALTSEASSFNMKLAALTKEKDDAARELEALKDEKNIYEQELSFVRAVTSTEPVTGVTSTTVSGVLSSGATLPYYLTTLHGLQVPLKNSRESKVNAALKPFFGKIVAIDGTRSPNVRDLTVTAVNGTPIEGK